MDFMLNLFSTFPCVPIAQFHHLPRRFEIFGQVFPPEIAFFELPEPFRRRNRLAGITAEKSGDSSGSPDWPPESNRLAERNSAIEEKPAQ